MSRQTHPMHELLFWALRNAKHLLIRQADAHQVRDNATALRQDRGAIDARAIIIEDDPLCPSN